MANEAREIDRDRLLFLLNTLEDMGETLTEGGSFDAAARYLLRMLLGSIGISNGAIFTYVSARHFFRLKTKTRGAVCEMDTIPVTVEMCRFMAETPVPYRIDRLPEILRTGFADIVEFWQKNRIEIMIPLAVRSDLLGMICLGRRLMNEAYSTLDLEMIRLLTRHISLYFSSQKSLEQARTANFELRRKILEMEQVYEVGLAITSLRKPDALLHEILNRAIAILDARYGAIWLLKDGVYTLAASFGFANDRSVPSVMPDLTGALEGAVRDGRDAALCLIATMTVRDRTLGVLSVAGKESRREEYQEFLDSDYRLLTLFANQAAVAVENAELYQSAIEKERMDRELAVAAEIQETLLPASFPDDPYLMFSALSLPCRAVGGDFFDFFPRPDGCLGIVIGDVSGKSVPAALLVSTFYGALHAMSNWIKDLPELVSRLNDLLVTTTPDNKFITVMFLNWNPRTRTMESISAGHEPALVFRRDGREEKLASGGLLLGLITGTEYISQTTVLESGDLVCMSTDGITDRINAEGKRFGQENFRETIKKYTDRSPAEIVNSVFSELEQFAGGIAPPDDQTLVLLKHR